MIKNKEIVERLFNNAKSLRIPISCTVELTQICIFKCSHCFIQGVGYESLSYEQYTEFIDQFCEKGGLFLTLTGGEVLMHPRFSEMYEYAYKKGLAITIFTNAYLLDSDIIKLFYQYPPRKIEVSIYGGCESTYAKVTKCAESYKRVVSNVDELIANNNNVHLKTVLFDENYMDFDQIKKLASDRNLPFKYDFKLMPKRNGEKINLQHQLCPSKVIKMELFDCPEKINTWRSNISKMRKNDMGRMFTCGAARYSCYLSSSYHLRICAAATFSDIDLNNFTFSQAWDAFEKYTKLQPNDNSVCDDCNIALLCDICPIWGYIINDDVECLGKEVELHCALAKERKRVALNVQN